MPIQIFAAVGMLYMIYHGFVPRRSNFVEEVEGTGGVASLGTTVNDPENVLHLEKDRAKEELQALACNTETRHYPQLMSAYVGIVRGQRVSPQDGMRPSPMVCSLQEQPHQLLVIEFLMTIMGTI
ncbi:hypothetical protein SARC_13887 [Sphaeroforma arctica JP610]|uniref:Uncharacterized protein n=1 Tax=Sphaeroforma arctica JP610 TaxID=667725 RepID=A0A0L0FA04_9EUKA|nr:hypothetical protein SARC_13887 [Sphaeroforma arctica JP610]KNC73554.1 hypothetical protein SARC_13887 [Sphaeroforma arctica JP610]|eukprot:XP_014147456.1 hypothetical protein SARC_13887 [Sphaeroforma arctica JP610]